MVICLNTLFENTKVFDGKEGSLVSSEFFQTLSRGGLSALRCQLFFCHDAWHLYNKTKIRCRFHIAELLSSMDAPLARSSAACWTLTFQ